MCKQKLTFETRKKLKMNKLIKNVQLTIDYSSLDNRDIYGFYLTNKTTKSRTKGLPEIGSFVDSYPDFLALESEPGLYHKTIETCVCWFKDDSKFDTIDGLYNSIIYKDIELLKYYKLRYENVKYFISVDYSTYGDFDEETILHNIKKSIVCYLWLTFECDAIVFPLMTYGDESTLEWCFEYILEGSNVAVSLKGVMSNKNKEMFQKALKVLIDTRKPKCLLVYADSKKESSLEMLSYAIYKGIKIIIVPNTLMYQNQREGSNGQKY